MEVRVGTHVCDLCKDIFVDQFKFFEHLKLHYESDDKKGSPGSSKVQKVVKSKGEALLGLNQRLAPALTNTKEVELIKKGCVSGRDLTTVLKDVSKGISHQIRTQSNSTPSNPTETLTSGASCSVSQAVNQTNEALLQPKPLKCVHCKKKFKKSKNYASHVASCKKAGKQRSTSTDSPITVIDSIPGHSFGSQGTANDDLEELSNSFSPKDACPSFDDGEDDDFDDETEQMYLDSNMCLSCDLEFTSKQNLDKHILEAHPDPSLNTTGGNEAKSSRRVSTGSDDPSSPSCAATAKLKNLPQCKICNRIYSHRNSLVYHMRNHRGERPYKCETCGKRFFATSALTVHKRLHSGEKPFTCDICQRQFRQWGDLKHHKISIHSNELSFQCEVCGKKFARKYSLVVHLRIHTGERNYKCEFCGKCFRAGSYLQNHRKIHTGVKPHKCPICQKAFRVKSDMRRHVESHKKIKVGHVIGAVSVKGLGETPELIPVVTCDTADATIESGGNQLPVINGSRNLIDILSGTSSQRNDVLPITNPSVPPFSESEQKDTIETDFVNTDKMDSCSAFQSTLPNSITIPMDGTTSDFMANGMTAVLQDTMTLYQGATTNFGDLIDTSGAGNHDAATNTIVFLYP